MDTGPGFDDYPGEKLVPCKVSQDLSMAASSSASSNTSHVLPEQTLRWVTLLYGLLSCQAGDHALCRPLRSGLPMQHYCDFLWVLSGTAMLLLRAYLKTQDLQPQSPLLPASAPTAALKPSVLAASCHTCCSSAASFWPCRHTHNHSKNCLCLYSNVSIVCPAHCFQRCLPLPAGAPRAALVTCPRACLPRPALVRCWPSSSITR